MNTNNRQPEFLQAAAARTANNWKRQTAWVIAVLSAYGLLLSLQPTSPRPAVSLPLEDNRSLVSNAGLSLQSFALSNLKTPTAGESEDQNAKVPQLYPALDELEMQFVELVQRYPNLAEIEQIGVSTARRRPIWGIRLANPSHRENDRPAVLFTALHHAREPAGLFICKAIMEELLGNYGTSTRHTRLLDSLDVWLVPIVNPDGYDYVLQSSQQFPWWRKNLRDNDGDGSFDPLIDGVDLNRNYDYNWQEGGDDNPSSWFYRGDEAFSELEIQAIRDLARRENFVIGVSYHSYGEAILYPWGNYHHVPDYKLIMEIVEGCASLIGRQSGNGTYGFLPLNGRVGQSSVWMYGELGVIDFTIEAGEKYFPTAEELPVIVRENLRGALYLLERALRSGISGHVFDAVTGTPLTAEVHVEGLNRTYVKARHSNGRFGRFDRLLLPGNYNLEIRQSGYLPFRLQQVAVSENRVTQLEVALHRSDHHSTNGN